jgi:hypothetical protein
LNRWIVQRIWSHRRKRWRNTGWKELPETNPIRRDGTCGLIPSIASAG